MTSAASHNGGRTQVNLSGLQTGGAFPFINLLKTGQAWSWADNTNLPVTPDVLDSDGYPTSLVHGGVYTVFYVPSQTSKPGNYVATWDGNGTIAFNMPNTSVSGSKTSSTGSGRYVFSTTATRFDFRITAVGSPRITNVKIFHADDEAALNSGEIFGVKFKQKLSEAGFGVIRFLNWLQGNTTNIRYWADRKPATYVFYNGHEVRSSMFTGTTTNVGNTYSVAAPSSWSGLVDKAIVHVVFNANATVAASTLNVGGTGDINILNEYSQSLSTSSYTPLGSEARSLATLVYDAALGAWIKQGGDSAFGSVGLRNGCPPELMLRLCAEVGAHLYLSAPALACTPPTDWHTQLATYCRDNAPSWMVPRFEGCNELWNTAPGFFNTHYANAIATAYGWGADYQNWYGKAISLIGQDISAVYGNDRTKYQVLCGVQTSTGDTSGNRANSAPRLNSTNYLLQSAPSGYTLSAGKDWVTHVCFAQYLAPSDRYSRNDLISGYAYSVTNAGNSAGQATIAAAYADTLASAADTHFNLAQCKIYYDNWKAWAATFGVNKTCGYEGGYSPDFLTTPVAGTGDPTNTSWYSTITATTKDATGCVLTLGANVINAELASGVPGTPAVVGMAVVISTSLGGMVELRNPSVRSVTFSSGGSANINGTNTLVLNQAVYFYGTLPNELIYDVRMQAAAGAAQSLPYYVVSAGNPFQISATRGGAAVTFASTGTSVTAQECWFVKTVVDDTHIKLDVDSSAFTTYTGGGRAIYVNSTNYSNNLRYAGKLSSKTLFHTMTNYNNFLASGGEFPSCFEFTGDVNQNSGLSSDIWAVLEDVHQSPNSPQFEAIRLFNSRKRRLIW